MPAARANLFSRAVDSLVSFGDHAVTAFNPEAGLRRMVMRERATEFSYDAAHPGTRRGNSGGQMRNAAPESWAINRDRIRIIWEARDAEKNFCFIAGVLTRLTRYVCGKIMYLPDTGGGEQVDQLYQEFFHDWCERCDLTGRMRFRELVAMAFRSMLRDGDFGFNILPWQSGEIPGALDEYRLQSIEADRIGSPIDAMQSETYIGGFTINEIGQIVSVRTYERTRFGQYTNPEEIDPENFIHLGEFTRVDQYRPVSKLAPVLPHARDIYEWYGLEKQAGKTASTFSAFMIPKDPYKKKSGNPSGLDWNSDNNDPVTRGTPTMQAKAGMVVQLENGESISFPNIPSRPSGAFTAFVNALFREMALGLDLPYGFIYNLAELGGNTSRVEVMQAQRVISGYQELLTDRVLNRVKNLVIARAIAFGRLPPAPNWKGGKWQFGPQLTGDVGYQTTSDIARVKMGNKSMAEWNAENGTTPREVALANANYFNELKAISEQTGVPIEMMNPDLFPGATQALAAMNTPPPPPPKDLISKLGGAKEMKPLLDTQGMYGRGEIDRPAAVESLISIYGISEEEAEALIPEGDVPALENAETEANKPPAPAVSDPLKRAGKPAKPTPKKK